MKEQPIFPNDIVAKIHALVALIPKGKVATYGQLAEQVGHNLTAQDVGIIMSRVPQKLNLPCHRVVNKTGILAPDYVFGGQAHQRKLLEEEGVQFMDENRIDMCHHLWGDQEQLSLLG